MNERVLVFNIFVIVLIWSYAFALWFVYSLAGTRIIPRFFPYAPYYDAYDKAHAQGVVCDGTPLQNQASDAKQKHRNNSTRHTRYRCPLIALRIGFFPRGSLPASIQTKEKCAYQRRKRRKNTRKKAYTWPICSRKTMLSEHCRQCSAVQQETSIQGDFDKLSSLSIKFYR